MRGNALRVKYIYCFFIVFFTALALRISYLQIFRRNFFHNLSQNQYYKLTRIEGRRGRILDCKGKVLATGLNFYSVIADPLLVSEPEQASKILSFQLGLPRETILKKLQKKKRFVWIKRKISWAKKEEIQGLSLKGIGFIKEEKRFYPQETIGASVLGIVDIDNKGLEGIELFYDSYLRGKNGWVRVLQDSASREVSMSPQILTPQDGTDVVLTIDSQIQFWAQKYLGETVKDFSAKAGSVVVMDARTGAIYALANYPAFNPNIIGKDLYKFMKNTAVTDIFEPGSVFKVVTLLAAIEENKFSDDDVFFCENGRYKIPGSVLHDWKPYGQLTFKDVFIKSSNIGVAKITNFLGKGAFYRYVKKLGIGSRTGVDFPGETKGMMKHPRNWSKTSPYIMSIGQEVGVNLLQLARMFAVVANGGYLVKPHLVKSIRGFFFTKDTSLEKKRVISKGSAMRAKNILREVVENGTGKRARLKEVTIAGKTGTAQKYDSKLKRYSSDKYRATFVGFLADFNPPLVIAVTVDEPMKQHSGGVVAAPLFRKVAEKVVMYLEREGSK